LRRLTFALVANGALLIVQVIGGLVFGSLALLADSAHMTSDVFALAVALVAVRLTRRPATDRHTYGYARAEILAAQINGVLLLAAAGAIVVEAIRRLGDPEPIDAAGVLVIGVLGLAVNGVSAFVVGHVAHDDLNMRAALWHLVADALGSLAVIAAALGAAVFGTDRLDTLASLFIAALVLVAAWRLLRDTTRVLLEAVPLGIDIAAVRGYLAAMDGVEAVHHLHVWSLDSAQVALSAHVVLTGPLSLHDAQDRAHLMKARLADEFGIRHATIEVECHSCIDEHAAAH
jgi:cobalt-zinc-cadmium efflux system protein